MCSCKECGHPLEQGYFQTRIGGEYMRFHPRCIPKLFYEEYPDRRHRDQLNLHFEKGGDEVLADRK